MTDQLPANSRADATMSLVLAAAGAERRNRPRALVLGACVLLVAAGVFALFSYQSLASAKGAIAAQRDQTRAISDLADEISSMTQQESTLIFEPDETIAGKLEALGADLGMQPAVLINQSPGGSVPGVANVIKKQYNPRTALRSIEIGPLVTWLARATDPAFIPGLTPTTIRLRALRTGSTDKPAAPGEADWELDVKFTRVERERGS